MSFQRPFDPESSAYTDLLADAARREAITAILQTDAL